MPTRNRILVSSLTALLLAAGAGLVYAAASEAEAAGVDALDASEEANQTRHSRIKLVLDRDGSAERLELVDLHDLEVGESRTLTTESGTPVVVTRDAEGFEIDLDGKKIRLTDHFAAASPEGSWTSADGDTTQFRKQIVVHEAGGEGEGGANVMILRNKVAVDENGAVIADSADGDAGAVVMMRRHADGPDSQAFAFTTAGGELPALALPLESTIQRLQASPKFQELDEATRARVIEALRETAPKAGAFVAGEPGARTIVLEIEDEDGPTESN